MLATLVAIALVVQDQAPLRASPQDSSPRQATLWQGEWLEVRGERQGFLQVYDHRRERPGYVRATQVRVYSLDETSVPRLQAVMEFVKETPGAEALGIGHAAALLRAAKASQVGPEFFAALGTMADRLARRATSNRTNDTALAAHLDVAASYGVKLLGFEREGRTRVCYDGEAFRRVLALGGSAEARLQAALALTRPECIDPALGPVELHALHTWRRSVLEQVDASALPPYLANRLHLRRAEVEATLAYQFSRRGELQRGVEAGERSVDALARVSKAELAEEDKGAYAATAVRVGASRAASAHEAPRPPSGPQLAWTSGQPGETCLRLEDAGAARRVLFERCTYGLVWPASSRRSAPGTAVTVAVQMLEGWTELWVFHQEDGEWKLDTLAPAAVEPSLGYVELAGFSPDGSRILVTREVVSEGRVKSSFQVLKRDTLAPERSAERPEAIGSFQRWSSADWRERTVSLR